MQIFQNLVAILGAFVAMYVSIYTLIRYRKEAVINTITINRTKWMDDVKQHIHEYIKQYIKNSHGNHDLKIYEARIRLYFRSDGESYINLSNHLRKCSAKPFSDEDYEKLLEYSQNVLHDMWRQMKLEAGISPKKQNEIYRKMVKFGKSRYRSDFQPSSKSI